jgi:serine/threonine-protein kinase ULK2
MSSFVERFESTPQQQRVKVVAGFALQQRLGSGSFATVYKGIRIPNQYTGNNVIEGTTTDSSSVPDTVAIKAIARTSEKLTKKVLQNLEIEISILRTYRHPNIVCMHNVQKTDRHFYLILEYCGGGDVQRLIRTRKSGRLTERLTRRLMRDLSAGLKFLWGQELIHRDIKPQNLLLTGALPLDEINDPDATPDEETRRRQINFPSSQFSLKIADFGFARHLQTASLAETLCGSPLYMAPEILQHHRYEICHNILYSLFVIYETCLEESLTLLTLCFERYDAKADLWSVGTVLFEMVAGRPPFNGENHIDLLRNIQRKAVRLPPDVRVSKACVNLLRLLLNRNPLSRAGFKEFFEACDAFVALGCEGLCAGDTGSCRIPKSNDLEAIPENDGASNSPTSSDSLMTVTTTDQQTAQQKQQPLPDHPLQSSATDPSSSEQVPPPGAHIVSPQMTSAPTPASAALIPNTSLFDNRPYHLTNISNRLSPLTSSPPNSGTFVNQSSINVAYPSMALAMPQASNIAQNWQQSNNSSMGGLGHANSVSQSQASTDDSGFVMVEHSAGSSRNDLLETPTAVTAGRGLSNPSQHYYVTTPSPTLFSRKEFGNPAPAVPFEERSRVSKGMLSTSPGTGKMLLGMVGRATIGFGGVASKQSSAQEKSKLGDDVASAAKIIATAEDVGRRAVSVAHLGDSRAYLGMRLLFKSSAESSSLLSVTPMEGLEEGPSGNENRDNATSESASTEIMVSTRRRSSTTSDKNMAEAIAEEEQGEEMPFAISPDAPSVTLPSRSSVAVYNRSTNMSSMRKSTVKTDPQTVRGHFGEALACYLKSLTMLKGSVGAAQRVAKDLDTLQTQVGRGPTDDDLSKMKRRCEVTSNWLCTQFRGVLERADAANVEISKLDVSSSSNDEEKQETVTNVTSVEELIYNHALASGRDGAVKHVLGQYDAARWCYRSAGLLAETLLMEASVGPEDRNVLEGYVDGFAARITELDHLMMHQSRLAGSSNVSSSRRGSGVVGLIGPPPAAPTTFVVGTPNSR